VNICINRIMYLYCYICESRVDSGYGNSRKDKGGKTFFRADL
jgi:hypothetical protein